MGARASVSGAGGAAFWGTAGKGIAQGAAAVGSELFDG
jgi:hypothetical protein